MPGEPIEVEAPRGPTARGTVFIASSSGQQSAHESETVDGSFFTHHLVAALRGAADEDGDGTVALSEAYAYAQRRTVRDAALYTEGEQHPSFRVTLTGRQDVPFTWTERGASRVVVGPRAHELQVLDLASGITAVELPASSAPMTLALDAGRYLLRRRDAEGATAAKEVLLEAGREVKVAEADLEPVAAAELREKAVTFDAPTPAPEARRTSEPRTTVHLTAPPGPPLTFFVATTRASVGAAYNLHVATKLSITRFDRLCTAPCDVELPAGTAVLGLSRADRGEVVEAGPLSVRPGMTIHGTYRDRSLQRMLGVGVISLGAVITTGLIVASHASGPRQVTDPGFREDLGRQGNHIVAAVTTGLISTTIGILLYCLSPDAAEIEAQ